MGTTINKQLDNNYKQSNAVTTVHLNRFTNKYSAAFLQSGDDIHSRECAAQNLVNYLCNKFNIPIAFVKVTNRNRPSRSYASRGVKVKTTIHGTYTVGSRRITLYNTTAVKQDIVAIKTLYETLLHEFIHHYDTYYLKIHSIHSAGFYKRITDLRNKLG